MQAHRWGLGEPVRLERLWRGWSGRVGLDRLWLLGIAVQLG